MTQRERWSAQKRRQRATEGTYAYNDVHGIGVAGMMKRFRQRRWGRKLADVRDTETWAYIEDRLQTILARSLTPGA